MNKVIKALVIILSVNIPFTLHAQNDVKNSQDHPLVQRYPGSIIKGYHYTDFDEYFVVTGSSEGANRATPTKKVEGEIYTIIYETASYEDSLLKIFKNFEMAFNQAGLTELFTCTQETCNRGMPKEIFGKESTAKRYLAADPWNMGNSTSYKFWSGVLNKDDKDIYVIQKIMVSFRRSSPWILSKLRP
jgi:OmpA-OmpF porin, OOP family